MNSDIYIEHAKREQPFTMDKFHNHDSYEIYYLHSGERQYFIQNTTFPVRTGDIVLINRHDLHKTMESGSNIHERTVINFRETFFPSTLLPNDLFSVLRSNQKVMSLSNKQKQIIEQMLESMLYEYTQKQLDYKLHLQSTLIQLLITLNRFAKEAPASKKSEAIPHNKKVAEIVRYLQYHYKDPFKLEVLSERFSISKYHLCRSFKQYTGFTPVEYIHQIRIKAAQKLLVETEVQIQVVSEQVGFNNIMHFNRVFKHISAVSPSKYRKNRI